MHYQIPVCSLFIIPKGKELGYLFLLLWEEISPLPILPEKKPELNKNNHIKQTSVLATINMMPFYENKILELGIYTTTKKNNSNYTKEIKPEY